MSNKVYVTVGVDDRVVPAGGNKDQVLAKASDNDYDFAWVDASGSGSGGVSPYPSIPLRDSDQGATGQANGYARGDHYHPANVSTDVADVKKNGTAALGSSDHYAKADHIHPSDDYPSGFVLDVTANIFDSAAELENLPHKAGRIAFVKIASS